MLFKLLKCVPRVSKFNLYLCLRQDDSCEVYEGKLVDIIPFEIRSRRHDAANTFQAQNSTLNGIVL